MNTDDFRWRGTLASAMGVLVTEQVGYIRPQETVTRLTVPGRGGTLVPLGGRGWDMVTYAPKCAIRPGANLEAIRQWLQGDGAVIFGSMQDWAFDATPESQIEMKPYRDGDFAGWTPMTVIFTCQPYRYRAEPRGYTYLPMTDAGAATKTLTITNEGNVESLPLIRMVGLGASSGSAGGSVTVGLNGKSFTFGPHNGVYVADSELMELRNEAGTSIYMTEMTGDFPTCAPGVNYMTVKLTSGSVMSRIGIDMRERWI